jgi:hypothetical protein
MKGRIGTVVVGLAAVAALIAVPAAMAAYTSPKLEITQTATGVVVKASLNPNDDPTAAVVIVPPTGTQLTTSQAPGTVLGPVNAIVKALDLAGADLPLEGQLVVAAPGQVPAATQTGCIGTATPIATWLMVLTAAGQTLTVPTYLVSTAGTPYTAIGPAFIGICLPPPDVPAGTPGRATFGAKVYSAELTINGVFSRVALGAWVSAWVPYTPGAGKPNPAGIVVAPAAIAPGAVSISAKRSGNGAVGPAARRSNRDGLRRIREVQAHDAEAREGLGERPLQREVRLRDVLPSGRGRDRRTRPTAMHSTPAGARRNALRERDRERIHGQEQSRQEEVASARP